MPAHLTPTDATHPTEKKKPCLRCAWIRLSIKYEAIDTPNMAFFYFKYWKLNCLYDQLQ